MDAAKTPASSFADLITPGDMEEWFEVGKVIGQGAYSTVRAAKEKATGRMVAVKYIERQRAFGDMNLNLECRLLRQLGRHPNINAFVGLYEDKMYYKIVLEYVKGGELLDILIKRVEAGSTPYSEAQVAVIMRQIMSAVEHCHKNGIVHRDLKPENVLVSDMETLGDTDSLFTTPLKLADFGLATILQPGATLRETCGTPNYMAPERLSRSAYDEKSDIWSIGVLMYILVAGTFPFYGETDEEIRWCACNPKEPEFGSEFKNSSKALMELLRDKLLAKDPANRPTASEVLQHPWMTGELASTAEIKGALSQLKRFNARRKFRASVRALVASNRLRYLLGAVRVEAAVMELVDFGITTAMVQRLNNVFATKTNSTFLADHDTFVQTIAEELAIPKASLVQHIFQVFHRPEGVPTRDFCLSLATKLGTDERERLELAFDIFDADGSGMIDQAEYSAMISAILVSLEDSFKPNQLWLQQEFDLADTDNSGSISKEEFVAAAGSNIKIQAYMYKVHKMLEWQKDETSAKLASKQKTKTGEVFMVKDRTGLFRNISKERWLVVADNKLEVYRNEKDWCLKKPPKQFFECPTMVIHKKPVAVRSNCKMTLGSTNMSSTYTVETKTEDEIKLWLNILQEVGAKVM